jgi:hypothetical protein
MKQTYQGSARMVMADLLDSLPDPVQRYLQWTGVVARPWIRTAHIRQSGRFRQSTEQSWMPLAAEQIFTTDPPSMVWNATFKMFGLPLMRARDSYNDGQGRMVGKVAGLYTLFDDHGEKLTQGTMIRYLSELIWLPTAYVSDFISWTTVDDQSAKVTFTDQGRTVSGRMSFDELGRPVTFETMRYKGENDQFELLPWQTRNHEYGRRDGLNLPIRSTATWLLPDGDLTYGDFTIDEVAYNRLGDHL